MKKVFMMKKVLMMMILAALALAVASCKAETETLDGVWADESGNFAYTIKGATAIITVYNPTTSAYNLDAKNKGMVKVGDEIFRNLSKTGYLTWTGQQLIILRYSTSPNVAVDTDWEDTTITMSADGKTIKTSQGDTLTRR